MTLRIQVLILFLSFSITQSDLVTYHFQIRSIIGNPDGYPRPVITLCDNNGVWNRRRAFPAPLIRAHFGDQLEIHFTNLLRDQSTSIHFHGLHMYKNVWMDGVAMITQCPIYAGNTFTYRFNVTQVGTFWYHSHSHQQYADGLIGPMIIDPPRGEEDPIQMRYPYDSKSDYVIMIQEWYHESWQDIMAGYQGPYNSSYVYQPRYPWPPTSLLINGRGQFDCHTSNCTEEQKSNECNETLQCIPLRDSYYGHCNPSAYPQDQYLCHNGEYARLRLINAASGSPLRFWIDQHSLLIVARDSILIEPYEVSYIAISVGQRLDVIVKCNQDPRYKYMMYVSFPAEFVAGVNPDHWVSALFVYPNATNISSSQLNPTSNFTDNVLFEYQHMKPLNYSRKTSLPAVKRLRFDFSVIWNNSKDDALEEWQINNKTFVNPTNQPLLQTLYLGENLTLSLPPPRLGRLGNSYETHIEYLELGQIYEILMVNNDIQQHPFHLHGHTIEFIAAGTHENLTEKHYDICNEYKFNMLPVDFDRVLRPFDEETEILSVGDTFTVPRKGFVVFRFKADNPGPWLLHCHMEWHINPGLVVILSVGNNTLRSYQDLLPEPCLDQYPTCSQTKQQWRYYRSFPGSSASKFESFDRLTSRMGIIFFLFFSLYFVIWS